MNEPENNGHASPSKDDVDHFLDSEKSTTESTMGPIISPPAGWNIIAVIVALIAVILIAATATAFVVKLWIWLL